VWLAGTANPQTPAGYVGYLTQGAVFGQAHFYGLQTGPTSAGRRWLLSVTNISITPYTFSEEFSGNDSVLSKDNLKIAFRVHVVWRVRPDRVQDFVEKYSTLDPRDSSDRVVQVAYNNFLREPLRTYARDEIQRLNGLDIKEQISPVGEAIFKRAQELTKDTPFEIRSIVVGNIQYPPEVADAVSRKLAATQLLEQKQTEIQIEEREKEKRIIQAEGIAKSMEIINQRLTAQYLQHEAIEAQKANIGSPNHTTVYIPVGPMGVPVVGTMDVTQENNKKEK
jgi:regulator of protease activity HflC (stomatin/prohibitin superfamily)